VTMRTPTISACLVVRNESLVLDRCLSNLSGAVDEIVVVDTGSTDATPEIVAGFGASICRYDWSNDFSAARNVGLDAASCDWILANAAVRLAQLAMGERRDDSVVHYADRALALEPNHVLAHYLSGLALTRLGRYAEAHAHLAAVRSSGKAGLSTAADLDALIAHCVSNQE